MTWEGSIDVLGDLCKGRVVLPLGLSEDNFIEFEAFVPDDAGIERIEFSVSLFL